MEDLAQSAIEPNADDPNVKSDLKDLVASEEVGRLRKLDLTFVQRPQVQMRIFFISLSTVCPLMNWKIIGWAGARGRSLTSCADNIRTACRRTLVIGYYCMFLVTIIPCNCGL
jgi:hypothetical protein